MENTRPEVEIVVPRHAPDCITHRSTNRLGQCRCPKYLYIRRDRIRISAKTRSWDIARQKAVEYANRHDPACIAKAIKDASLLRLEDAAQKFYAHLQAGGTGPKSIANMRSSCNQLKTYAAEHKVEFLQQITPTFLSDWMGTWKGRTKLDRSGNTSDHCTLWSRQKKRKHVNRFFKHCVAQQWIEKNPAEGMPVVSRRNNPSPIPKLPFTREQMTAILMSAAGYRNRERAISSPVMMETMRRSGLAIADTVRLERTRLKGNRLELYRTKTGEPVFLLIPPTLADKLHRLTPRDSRYFFWNGKGTWESAANGWGKVFRVIFKNSKVKLRDRDGNPLPLSSHFFRNTFAKEMLETGRVSIDQLAILMADDPKTIREHYAKWVPDLQNQLDDAVIASWSFAGERTRAEARSQ